MIRLRFGIVFFAALAWLIATGPIVVAQQPAEQPAPPAERPAPSPAADRFAPKDPAVEAILATRPEEPAECARAAKILADLGRPDLAKEQLKKVLDANLDAEQLAGLADRLGPALFAELATRSELAPEAKTLGEAVLAAARAKHEAPERITQFIDDLKNPAADVRARAVAGLRQAGAAAVAPLVAVLADPARKAEHAAVRGALGSLGEDAALPLAGYLAAPDSDLVVQVIRVLADAGSSEVSIHLLAPFASPESDEEVRAAAAGALLRLVGPLPTPAEAAAILAERARDYYDRRRKVRADGDGLATLWQWDAAAGRGVARRLPPAVAGAVLAAQLAGDALAIEPGNADVRQLYLLTNLEKLAYTTGLDSPLPLGPGTASAPLAEFGPEAIETALASALADHHAPAAAAAARILGRVGTAEMALGGGPRPGPLARALRSPDRRVRLAAARAIMNLQPVRSFAGSSYLPEALAFLATSTGARRAMVAGPSTEDSRAIGGFLVEQGFEVDTAVTGREMLEKLLASADYELVLVDARIDQPPIHLLVQQLRHDCRTACLPVGILATEDRRNRARRAAQGDPLAEVFPRPHDGEAARWQVDRLQTLARDAAVAPDVRLAQAAEALGWLAELGGEAGPVYDVRRAEASVLSALHAPQLGEKAVAALAQMGTPRGQKALVDLASRRTQPLALRQAALAAFLASTDKHGILLTTDEILLQYARYNQSAQADADTQAVLGGILDAIEAPSRAKSENDQ
ncbi:MAG: hypothetical protein JW809_17555 [Pirellulales bacterium]|nr:hypothetical protein [Pirellulales bacterium]